MTTNMTTQTPELSRRQNEIVAAALDIISTGGLEALTIRALAERIGFRDAAVYRHFPSKQAILESIVARLERQSLADLEAIAADRPGPLESIRRFFIGRCRLFAADRPLVSVMFSDELFRQAPEVADRYAAMMETHRQALHRFIRLAQGAGEISARLPAEHVFMVVIGALRLLLTRWRLGQHEFDLERAGAELWRSLAAMLSGNPPRAPLGRHPQTEKK